MIKRLLLFSIVSFNAKGMDINYLDRYNFVTSQYKMICEIFNSAVKRSIKHDTLLLLIDHIEEGRDIILHLLHMYRTMPLQNINKLHCYIYEYHCMKVYLFGVIGS